MELPDIQYRDRPGIIDLSWGHPMPSLLPVEAWQVAAEATLSGQGWRALTYGYAAGPGPLVEWLSAHLAEVDLRAPGPAETFVTTGASQGLELLLSALTRPDDVVLVDSPTYHLALRTIADHRVEVVGAPADRAGIDPEATNHLVRQLRATGRRVSLLYLVPTHANPTGRCLPDDRRQALVELSRDLPLPVIEDDTYRDLTYDAPAPASLWSLADNAPVIRLGSFSKTVAPGVRLGWLNAHPDLITTLTSRGYVHSGGGLNHTTALTMAEYATSGAYTHHLTHIQSTYTTNRNALTKALHPVFHTPTPAGGWFLWLPLPPGITAKALLPEAEAQGVSFLPGPGFFVTGEGNDHIRLSFSMYDPATLTEAAHRLGQALTATPTANDDARSATKVRTAYESPQPPEERP
jgi:DNA-binding transcriptional MocR family regulator